MMKNRKLTRFGGVVGGASHEISLRKPTLMTLNISLILSTSDVEVVLKVRRKI
jgi:hypothetical protein